MRREYWSILAALLGGGLLGRWVSSLRARTVTPVDLRVEGRQKLQERENQSGKAFSRKTPRDLSEIDSIVLHQMGFSRGSDPTKYLGVPAHFIVLPDGTVGQLHDFETYLYTSNGLNSRSIGVAIAGNFPNVDGEWWKPEKFGADRPTAAQINAIQGLIRYIGQALEDQGEKLRGVFAHRQSSAAKRNDPGPDVWRGVSPVFADLGLEDVSDFSIDSGSPIPDAWKSDPGVYA